MFAKANYGVTPGSRVLSVPQFADTSKVMSTPKYFRAYYLVGHLKPTIPQAVLTPCQPFYTVAPPGETQNL